MGTRVRLAANGRVQTRTVSGGTGFASQSERRLHFGLGKGVSPQYVEIHWPSGGVQRIDGDRLEALIDRTTCIAEGRAPGACG